MGRLTGPWSRFQLAPSDLIRPAKLVRALESGQPVEIRMAAAMTIAHAARLEGDSTIRGKGSGRLGLPRGQGEDELRQLGGLRARFCWGRRGIVALRERLKRFQTKFSSTYKAATWP